MSEARDYDASPALTPEQRLIAAHMHIVGGVAQHTIAGAFGVNPGRVAEAIQAGRFALDNPAAVLAAKQKASS